MKRICRKNPYIFIVIAILILIIPAFFINLGMLRLIDDEGIRALVALEMKIKGDLITPTLGGEFYYKKPPLYNWIILLFFNIFNRHNEWIIRLPAVLALFGYCTTIFFVVKRKYNKRMAFLAAMIFLVSARVLLYESLWGLIDMTYSWITFVNFILIWYYFQRKKFLLLFLVSYSLTAIGFLMKTYPSVVFQGITLLVIFIGERKFKKLFSWEHLVGVLPFVVLVGGYYLAYYNKNPGQFSSLVGVMYSESANKSTLGFQIAESVKNIFTYSFEVLYNYVPGTLILIYFIRKKPFTVLKEDPFLLYLMRVFLFNIIIYLISPVSYMRYVLMLMPLLFIIFLVYYEKNREENTIHSKITDIMFLVVSIILSIGMLVFPMNEKTGFVSYAWTKAIVLSILMLTTVIMLAGRRKFRLEMLIIILLFIRIGFNLFIIPSRIHNHWEIEARENTLMIGKETKDEKLYNAFGSMNVSSLYYLTAGRMDIVESVDKMNKKGYYIVYDPQGKYKKNTCFTFQIPNFVLSVVKYD